MCRALAAPMPHIVCKVMYSSVYVLKEWQLILSMLASMGLLVLGYHTLEWLWNLAAATVPAAICAVLCEIAFQVGCPR